MTKHCFKVGDIFSTNTFNVGTHDNPQSPAYDTVYVPGKPLETALMSAANRSENIYVVVTTNEAMHGCMCIRVRKIEADQLDGLVLDANEAGDDLLIKMKDLRYANERHCKILHDPSTRFISGNITVIPKPPLPKYGKSNGVQGLSAAYA